MENRAFWGDLVGGVGLEIAEVYNQGQEQYTPGISSILTSDNFGETGKKNFRGKTGSGRLKKFNEGDAVPSTSRSRSYLTEVAVTDYGQSLEVTRNQIMDRDFSAELDEMADMSRGANYSQDEAGLQLFNGGFATTTAVNGYDMTWYGDAVPQFSTVHPTQVSGGSTQSNASATGIKFNDDNLETGKVATQLQQTDDGFALSMLGSMSAVLPMNLEKEGKVVTMSTQVSGNANNDINVYSGGTMDIITSPFLDATNNGSNTAWFLIVPGRVKLYHSVRQAPTLEQEVDIKTKTVTFTVDARWANFSKDWRRSWGSKGDLATCSS